MTRWADVGQVAAAVEQWSDGQIQCRAYGHNWRSLTVFHRPGYYTITQRCARCRNERERDITEQGATVGSWSMRYTKGYLLDNAGRVDTRGRDLIRLASLQSLSIVEVTDEE